MSSKINHPLIDFLRRYHFFLTATFVIVALLLEGFFLYRYFYRPFVTSKALIEVKQYGTLEPLRTSLYTNMVEFQKKRLEKSTIDWTKIRDPFITLADGASVEAPAQ